MALTAEEQARLLEGTIPGGLLLAPQPEWAITGRPAMEHWKPQVVEPAVDDAPAGLGLLEKLTGGQRVTRQLNPQTGRYELVPVVEPELSTPAPQLKLGGGPGGNTVAPPPLPPPPPPPPKEDGRNPSTPSSISAYKTKDGKVFFTNQEPPEGATSLSYAKGLEDIKAPGGGGYIFAQQPPEEQQMEQLRDAILKQRLEEAMMTPDQRLAKQIAAQKQLGAAGTQMKLDEMKQLSDLLMGSKMTKDHPMWPQFVEGAFKNLRAKNPKAPEEQLRAEAERLTQMIADREYAQNMLQLYMIQNRSQMLPVAGE